jgi:hypothetical protein
MKSYGIPLNGLVLLLLGLFFLVYQRSRISTPIAATLDPMAVESKEATRSDGPALGSDMALIETLNAPRDQKELDVPVEKELAELLSLVQDNTFEIQQREMPAYWRLVGLASQATFESMNAESRKDFVFNDFYRHAEKNRGALASMTLNVRRIQKYAAQEGNAANVKDLYEVWGWSSQAKAWLYVFVTPNLPAGIAVGEHVQHRVRFVGYFFKLQAYQPALAKPDDRPLVAPLFVGRFEPLAAPIVTDNSIDTVRTLALLGVGAMLTIGVFTFFNTLRSRRIRKESSYSEGQSSVEDLSWLTNESNETDKPAPKS